MLLALSVSSGNYGGREPVSDADIAGNTQLFGAA
jgi:hypothetical protein